MPSKLDAALAWAARGFRVFPLPPNGTRPTSDWKGWPEHATTDPAKIRAWWEGTDCNIAVCTTGLLVVDIDVKKGRAGLASWQALHGHFDTLTVRTRSGGYHLYYSGADVALSQGALGEGLDVRSHNGYVVAPGSIVDGLGYEVVVDVPMAQAPAHIVARCKPPGQRDENAHVPLVDLDSENAVRAAAERVARAPGAVSGEQSESAYRLAAAVRDYGISEAMCNTLMQAWAARCSPPILPDDLAGRIANAYAYAQNPPGVKSTEAVFASVRLPPPPPPPPPPAAAGFGNAIKLADLAPRPHVYRGMLIRGEVTGLIAAGGVGKSLFQLFLAVHLALGRPFLGHEAVIGRARSVIYNAEDSLSEMSMRLHAICTTMAVDFAEVQPWIYLISGKKERGSNHPGRRLRLVNGPQPERNDAHVEELIAAAREPDVGFVGLDPLNKLHSVNGSDNIAMGFVMDVIELIAEEADVAMMVAHHISKPTGGRRTAGNADASQGAAAITNGTRNSLTLSAPEDEDAARYALRPGERDMLIRLDGAKNNRGLRPAEPQWMRKVSVSLWNGEAVGSLEEVTDIRSRRDDLLKLIAQLAANFLIAGGHADRPCTEIASAIVKDAMLADYGLEAVTAALHRMQDRGVPVSVQGRAARFEVGRAGTAYRGRLVG